MAIGGGEMSVLANNWLRRSGSAVGGEFSSRSTGSEHDLAVLVSDFVEIGSAGAESWCSSDSDSGFSDLAYLADRISVSTISFSFLNDFCVSCKKGISYVTVCVNFDGA